MCYIIYVLLWLKYWLMWFEILLVFILFKFKKRPNISEIRVVKQQHGVGISNMCLCVSVREKVVGKGVQQRQQH